ncbi:MAG: class I SAM-dependent methyltransferase [Candidatus Competibacter sp.]
MSAIEKLKTFRWFLARPSHWAQAVDLGKRKFMPDRDSPELRAAAREWAAVQAVTVSDALDTVGLAAKGKDISRLSTALLDEARSRAARSKVAMGGAGDIDLLYAATVLSGALHVVETGVAYGWSSLAILAALESRDDGRLISVDMPYPKMNNEDFVGIVVPERLRNKWALVREPDRNGLVKAIAQLGGSIDLCHYDSDKSWYGRQFGYRLMWEALRPGGVFISDDIQDNFAFRELVETRRIACAVTGYEGKFVGIVRKP